MKVIDTNILLHNPNILEEIEDAVITIRVIEEIDGLKKITIPKLLTKLGAPAMQFFLMIIKLLIVKKEKIS